MISPEEEISYRVQERLKCDYKLPFYHVKVFISTLFIDYLGDLFSLAHFTTDILVPANSSRKAHLFKIWYDALFSELTSTAVIAEKLWEAAR